MKKRLLEIYEEEEFVSGEVEIEKGDNETNYDMQMSSVDSEDNEDKDSSDDEDTAEIEDHDDEEDFDEEE